MLGFGYGVSVVCMIDSYNCRVCVVFVCLTVLVSCVCVVVHVFCTVLAVGVFLLQLCFIVGGIAVLVDDEKDQIGL